MNEILKPHRSIILTKFARHLNYPRASNHEFKEILSYLEKRNILVVQQGGFLGDSMHHPKLVTILKPLELDKFKHVILGRVNYSIGDFTVHRTTTKRKCLKCKHVIAYGERYAVKIHFGITKKHSRQRIYALDILCLPCLLEKVSIDDEDSEVQVY